MTGISAGSALTDLASGFRTAAPDVSLSTRKIRFSEAGAREHHARECPVARLGCGEVRQGSCTAQRGEPSGSRHAAHLSEIDHTLATGERAAQSGVIGRELHTHRFPTRKPELAWVGEVLPGSSILRVLCFALLLVPKVVFPFGVGVDQGAVKHPHRYTRTHRYTHARTHV